MPWSFWHWSAFPILTTDKQVPAVLAVGAGCFFLPLHWSLFFAVKWGWSGGAKVLGKLSVPGRPTSLDDSRARAQCACSRCRWGFFWTFFPHLSFVFCFSLSLGDGPI